MLYINKSGELLQLAMRPLVSPRRRSTTCAGQSPPRVLNFCGLHRSQQLDSPPLLCRQWPELPPEHDFVCWFGPPNDIDRMLPAAHNDESKTPATHAATPSRRTSTPRHSQGTTHGHHKHLMSVVASELAQRHSPKIHQYRGGLWRRAQQRDSTAMQPEVRVGGSFKGLNTAKATTNKVEQVTKQRNCSNVEAGSTSRGSALSGVIRMEDAPIPEVRGRSKARWHNRRPLASIAACMRCPSRKR